MGEVLEPLDRRAASMAGKAASIARFCIFATTVYFFARTSTSFCYHQFLGLLELAPNFINFATTSVLVCWSELCFLLPLAFFDLLEQRPICMICYNRVFDLLEPVPLFATTVFLDANHSVVVVESVARRGGSSTDKG